MNSNQLINGNQKQLTYESAQEELEQILKKIQEGTISVDELTTKVKRSSELIRFCKQKLREVDEAIQDVFEEIEEEPTGNKCTEMLKEPEVNKLLVVNSIKSNSEHFSSDEDDDLPF